MRAVCQPPSAGQRVESCRPRPDEARMRYFYFIQWWGHIFSCPMPCRTIRCSRRLGRRLGDGRFKVFAHRSFGAADLRVGRAHAVGSRRHSRSPAAALARLTWTLTTGVCAGINATTFRLMRETAISPKREMYRFHWESCLVFIVLLSSAARPTIGSRPAPLIGKAGPMPDALVGRAANHRVRRPACRRDRRRCCE